MLALSFLWKRSLVRNGCASTTMHLLGKQGGVHCPLPCVGGQLDQLAGDKLFTSLDLATEPEAKSRLMSSLAAELRL